MCSGHCPTLSVDSFLTFSNLLIKIRVPEVVFTFFSQILHLPHLGSPKVPSPDIFRTSWSGIHVHVLFPLPFVLTVPLVYPSTSAASCQNSALDGGNRPSSLFTPLGCLCVSSCHNSGLILVCACAYICIRVYVRVFTHAY